MTNTTAQNQTPEQELYNNQETVQPLIERLRSD